MQDLRIAHACTHAHRQLGSARSTLVDFRQCWRLLKKRKVYWAHSHRAVLAVVAASLQSPDAEEEEFDAESYEEEKSRHAILCNITAASNIGGWHPLC